MPRRPAQPRPRLPRTTDPILVAPAGGWSHASWRLGMAPFPGAPQRGGLDFTLFATEGRGPQGQGPFTVLRVGKARVVCSKCKQLGKTKGGWASVSRGYSTGNLHLEGPRPAPSLATEVRRAVRPAPAGGGRPWGGPCQVCSFCSHQMPRGHRGQVGDGDLGLCSFYFCRRSLRRQARHWMDGQTDGRE